MRRRGFLALVALLLLVIGPQRLLGLVIAGPGRAPPEVNASGDGTTLRILSFNVLCSWCTKDGYEPWEARVPHLRAVLERYDPDIAAILELTDTEDAADLLGPDPRWGVITASEHYADATILYRKSAYTVIDHGALWLSPTPRSPFGWSWVPWSLPRYVAWAALEGKGGHFVFAATHVDAAKRNREGAAPLLGSLRADILAGDLNMRTVDPSFETARGLLRDATWSSEYTESNGPTEKILHSRRELEPDHAIDHILVPAGTVVSRFIHDAPTYGDPARRPSDHPVVVADVRLPEP